MPFLAVSFGLYPRLIEANKTQANGMLRLYDPQSGKKYDLLDWISKMDKRYTVNVLRVDNLNIASNIIQEIVEPLK